MYSLTEPKTSSSGDRVKVPELPDDRAGEEHKRIIRQGRAMQEKKFFRFIIWFILERATGFEPATFSLGS